MNSAMLAPAVRNLLVALLFITVSIVQSCAGPFGLTEKEMTGTEDTVSQTSASITGLILEKPESGWTMRSSLFDRNLKIKACYFLTPEIGWAIGAQTIFKTQDGGNNWAATDLNFINSSEIKFLHFLDEANGRIVLQDGGDEYSDQSQVSVFSTSDGGKEWVLAHFENSSVVTDAYFGNTQTWLVGRKFIGDYPRRLDPLVIKHLNDSNSWKNVAASNYPLGTGPAQIVAGLDGCLLLADKVGRIARSCDSGGSWEPLAASSNFPPDSSYRLFSVGAGASFVWTLESAGGMGGSNSVLTIIPQESNQTKVAVSLPGSYLRSAIAVSSREFYLVGKWSGLNDGTHQFGTILHTVDGGKSWRHVIRTDSPIIAAQFFPEASQIWLLTADGVMVTLKRKSITTGGASNP